MQVELRKSLKLLGIISIIKKFGQKVLDLTCENNRKPVKNNVPDKVVLHPWLNKDVKCQCPNVQPLLH